MSKIFIGIVVAVVILAGAWYVWSQTQASLGVAPTQSAGAELPQTGQQPSAQEKATSQASVSNTSDLDAGLSSIDTQLQGASSDTSSAGSFNDTPVQQTEQ